MRLPGDLEPSLAGWLPRQRWFAGKGREIDKLAILTDTILASGDPGLHHVIVGVHQDGSVDRYQLLLGTRSRLPDRLLHAEIEHSDLDVRVYDAAHDPELTGRLLRLLAEEADLGPISFHTTGPIETGLSGVVGTAEQSNTSIIFGTPPGPAYIWKLFRRVSPGSNPDLELNLGLARVGCRNVPRLFGWVTDDSGATLAMVSEYLSTASDGWALATASVRDLLNADGDSASQAGGDFAAEAERLGAATAAIHHDLAAAFGVSEMSHEEVGALAEGMHNHLTEAIMVVPQLGEYAGALREVFDLLRDLEGPLPVQPIHGDYHLGQVLRGDAGWMVLDFEGEPGRSAAERRTASHPLRDVAGMLRSFDYAALYLLQGERRLHAITDEWSARAVEWSDRNRAAFCRGYASAGGPDPSAHDTLVRAFEFDKAVYEAVYEARNRPSWLGIPLGSLNRALSRRSIG